MGTIIINIMKILTFILILVIIIYIIKEKRAISYERRIGRYSIDSIKTQELSLFDKLYNNYKKIILYMRNYLTKSKLLVKLSEKYDKYSTYDSDKVNIDYISTKILLGIVFTFLSIFSHILQGKIISIIGIIINFIIGYYLYDLYLIYYQKRKIRLIRNEMLRAIIIMNNAFKSGKSTIQAVDIASRELPEPISSEFKKIHLDMKYGLSISTVFDRFAKRNDIPEARYLAATLTTLNKTGGNIVKVFSSIERALFDKKKLDDELKNLTAGPNLVVRVLLFVPFVFVFLIYLLDPTYFNPLFQTTLGYLVIAMIIIMFIIYVLFLQKIMKVNK